MGLSTSYKFEGIKQVFSLSTLRNGGLATSKSYAAIDGLHMQTRLKRCLLFGSIEQRLEENDTISMVRCLLRVYLPLVWLRFCTKGLYKTSASSYINIAEIEYKDSHYVF